MGNQEDALDILQDTIMTLYENLGQGQIINKSYTFSDGTVITLDKIFFDDNELVALYTEKLEQKPVNSSDNGTVSKNLEEGRWVRVRLKGLLGYYSPKSGRGHSNETSTVEAWAMSFEPLSALEKWMDFTVEKQIHGKLESGNIPFTLDRNKAIAYGIKQDLNQTITINDKQITFKSLTVTPLSTVIRGNLNNFSSGKRLSFDLVFDLVVDGKLIRPVSGGMSSSDFELQFDGINQAHTIEIANIRIIKEQMIDEEIPISNTSQKVEIGTGDAYFAVESVSSKDGKTYLEITRKNNVEAIFGLFASDKQLNQLSKKTLSDTSNQENDMIREILEYDGSSASLRLAIKVLQINTPYEGKVGILQ